MRHETYDVAMAIYRALGCVCGGGEPAVMVLSKESFRVGCLSCPCSTSWYPTRADAQFAWDRMPTKRAAPDTKNGARVR